MNRAEYKTYFQPAFLICVVVLAVSGIAMSITIEWLGVELKKEPLLLKKSLDDIDANALGPYKIVAKRKIEHKEMVEELGTSDYIDWILEDTEVPPESELRQFSLFITHYSLPDVAPHVPDECYMGVGYQRLGGGETVSLELKPQSERDPVRARYVVFTGGQRASWLSDKKFAVMYLFRVNGDYTVNRTETRSVLGKNVFGKYSYYSKVEWKFFNGRFGQTNQADKVQVIQASERLMSVLLPLLENEHWPDWPVKDDSEGTGSS